jgi:hypothetical protein
MPHLAVMRRGWQNEHLAAFILSRMAFVAHPAKIGDDVGTDFFCTFFEVLTQEGTDYLVPRTSFAIQIKSSGTTIDVTKQIEYLIRLELPFFVGIIDQEHSTLTIYSAEYLPVFFSHLGIPNRLTFDLCPNHNFRPESYFEDMGDKSYKLKCPMISTLSVSMSPQALAEESQRLRKIATRIHENIAARTSCEYVFNVGYDGQSPAIVAGSGSIKVFRANFKKRLAEAFSNLSWIADNQPLDLDIDECQFYLQIYDNMRQRDNNLPLYLVCVADELKKQLVRSSVG